jgi:predicted amidohydrolase
MNSHPVLIRNARLIDPATGKTEQGSIAIQDGVIAALGGVSMPMPLRKGPR